MPDSVRKIRYLISPAGVPNFGDELITRSWLRYLAEVEPDSEVWLDCISPSRASHLFYDDHPNLHITSTAWSLVWNAQDAVGITEYGEQRALVAKWVRKLGTPKEDLGIIRMLEADSIHLLGGGYINDRWEANHALLPYMASVAKEVSGMELFATGLGVAPWDEGDPRLPVLRNALSGFDYVSLREGQSAELVGTGKVGSDDAWLAFAPECDKGLMFAKGKRDDLEAYASRAYVAIHPTVSEVGGAYVMGRVVDALLASGVDPHEGITLVEAITPDDSRYLDELRDAWAGEVTLLPFSVLWREGFPGGKDAVWITSRYHMHLVGAATGARGVAVMGGDGYYDIKHGALLDAGTGWPTLRLGEGDGEVGAARNGGFGRLARSLTVKKRKEAKELYG